MERTRRQTSGGGGWLLLHLDFSRANKSIFQPGRSPSCFVPNDKPCLQFVYIPTTYVSNRCRSTHDVKKARQLLRASDYWPVTRMNYHTDPIHQLKEKCREYNIPLCVAFVDYEKAFDSVQTQAILTSLQEQGTEYVYIEILKDTYTDSSVTVHLHKESEKIRIKRGVRQGDTISPKLFTATLESIILFRRLNWENKGVKIDGEFLSNIRFADDIFLCTETPQELQQMLQELSGESRQMGLKINITKTNVMVVDNTPINVNNVLIENAPGYVYLGQHYSLKKKNQDKEIQRRIMAGWAAYAKHRDIFKSNLAICLKRQVYNSCVLRAMTYGAETWTLTKQAQNKLAAAQTKMERGMLNITYKDRMANIWVRERTKLIDIIYTVRKMKWSWAGHINRLKDDRWTSRVTTWRP